MDRLAQNTWVWKLSHYLNNKWTKSVQLLIQVLTQFIQPFRIMLPKCYPVLKNKKFIKKILSGLKK